eukprot:1012696-Rhodomonas_salina.2
MAEGAMLSNICCVSSGHGVGGAWSTPLSAYAPVHELSATSQREYRASRRSSQPLVRSAVRNQMGKLGKLWQIVLRRRFLVFDFGQYL